MNTLEAIETRHSVRSFSDTPISADIREQLESEVSTCNSEGNLHMQLYFDEPNAFDSTLSHYGKFANVRNYLVIASTEADDLAERGGYYGERVALLAQALGLNSCWVALTFKRRYVKKLIAKGEKLVVVIALGYGTSAGSAHTSKSMSDVTEVPTGTEVPEWFNRGVETALLAPTAMNQQKFTCKLIDDTHVALTSKGGAYSDVDLGIVRYHFEQAAGRDSFVWADGWNRS